MTAAVCPAYEGAKPREIEVAEGLLFAVCRRLRVDPVEARSSRSRTDPMVTRARHEWWTALWASGWAYARVARVTGYDRTTVMAAVRKELAR